jgi:hypothetical protein
MDEATQVCSTEAQFTVEWEHERPSIPCSLSAMLEANADSPSVCAWLRAADKVGLEYRAGGGASPLCVIRRTR